MVTTARSPGCGDHNILYGDCQERAGVGTDVPVGVGATGITGFKTTGKYHISSIAHVGVAEGVGVAVGVSVTTVGTGIVGGGVYVAVSVGVYVDVIVGVAVCVPVGVGAGIVG